MYHYTKRCILCTLAQFSHARSHIPYVHMYVAIYFELDTVTVYNCVPICKNPTQLHSRNTTLNIQDAVSP